MTATEQAFALAGVQATELALHQGRNVRHPLPERRELELHDGQAVEKVRAEALGLDLSPERAVRRGDHANVDGCVVIAANSLDVPFLEHAKDLGCSSRVSSPTSSRKRVPPDADARELPRVR